MQKTITCHARRTRDTAMVRIEEDSDNIVKCFLVVSRFGGVMHANVNTNPRTVKPLGSMTEEWQMLPVCPSSSPYCSLNLPSLKLKLVLDNSNSGQSVKLPLFIPVESSE